MDKPTQTEDLIPPFTSIGEGDWAERIRKRLMDYDVPLLDPVSEAVLRSREEQLGFRLPESLRLFFTGIGPIDELVKIGLFELSWGYWGWPDPEVAGMAQQVKRSLFGKDVL